MKNNFIHPIIKRVGDLHFPINQKVVKINPFMKANFMDMLEGDQFKLFVNENNDSNEGLKILDPIYKKLLECIYDVNYDNEIYPCKYEDDNFDDLILLINKICNTCYHSKTIDKKLNDDIDFLIR